MTGTTQTAGVKQSVHQLDGTRVVIRTWEPAERCVATVVIIPGFNAHSGRYEWVAQQFLGAGISTYAVDLRGRGESDGERFHVDRFTDYVSDVDAAIELARSQNPDIPLFLMGHSAGGVLACLAAIGQQAELSGLICESFSFELPAPAIALATLRGLSHVMPHLHVVKLNNAFFSRDADVVRSMGDDPLIAGEVETVGTIAEMTRASAELASRFAELTLPLLILHGTADKVAEPSGSQAFYDAAGSTDKALRIYDGHFHDLLNDLDKEVVFQDIRQWLQLRLPLRLVAPTRGSRAAAVHP